MDGTANRTNGYSCLRACRRQSGSGTSATEVWQGVISARRREIRGKCQIKIFSFVQFVFKSYQRFIKYIIALKIIREAENGASRVGLYNA